MHEREHRDPDRTGAHTAAVLGALVEDVLPVTVRAAGQPGGRGRPRRRRPRSAAVGGLVATGRDPGPASAAADAGPPGVGSNGTQPEPWKYSSGHACSVVQADDLLALHACGPSAKPTATRAGMPSWRAITAIVEANCTQ